MMGDARETRSISYRTVANTSISWYESEIWMLKQVFPSWFFFFYCESQLFIRVSGRLVTSLGADPYKADRWPGWFWLWHFFKRKEKVKLEAVSLNPEQKCPYGYFQSLILSSHSLPFISDVKSLLHWCHRCQFPIPKGHSRKFKFN